MSEAKSLADRQRALRDRRKDEGLKRKEYWGTDKQHKQLKAFLEKMGVQK